MDARCIPNNSKGIKIVMRNLKQILVEKLHINKNVKLEILPETEDVLRHFEIDALCKIDNDRLEEEPYITKKDVKEITNKINDFILSTNCNVKNFHYYAPDRMSFFDDSVAKDFKKDTNTLMNIDKLQWAEDIEIIFNGRAGIKIVSSLSKRQLAMYGPYGGTKLCTLENPYK